MDFKKQSRRWLVLAIVCCVLAFVIGIVIGVAAGRHIGHNNGGDTTQSLQNPAEEDQVDLKKRLISYIDPQNILGILRYMSSEPHVAGSERQNELADWVEQKWRDYGVDHVEKTPYRVLLSYPNRTNPNKVSVIDTSESILFETAGFERKLSADQNHPEVVPPFNAYAPAGDVQGQLVYVNYGRASDFEELQSLGVNVTGKIAIARYGKIYRGNKLNEAAKHGAIGLILYTDPQNNVGADKNAVFPSTWWLPGTGIQRGTTAMHKGDQLTEGYPAKDYAYRLPMDEYREHVQLPIPCQPIGYDEAWQLLSRLGGAAAPNNWQGGLNVTYRLGPGFSSSDSAEKVRLQVHNTEVLKTIHNVVGRIEGAEEPDRYVIMGSHRDAWMYGSVDALSSQAGMMDVVKAFGRLKSTGWRPRRTLIFISWDAEEYGMVGSYEWVEQHWKTLNDRAVAYLNGDTTLTGNWSLKAFASPVLNDIMMTSTKQVADPHEPSKSLYDTWRKKVPEHRYVPNSPPRILVPGSGTDYAHFLYFVGIPITFHKFQSNPADKISAYPLYHSVYETFQLINLIDPEAKVMTAAAQVWAILAMSLADSELLPFNVSSMARVVQQYVITAQGKYGYRLQSQGITFDALESATANFTDATENFQNKIKRVNLSNPLEVRRINDKMMKLERTFIDRTGQPGRSIYKHVVFSPSSKDNYSGSVFAGLADLLYDIERSSNPGPLWEEVKKHFAIIIHTIQSAADFLNDP